MTKLRNPFDNPTTLRDPEHFIGRSAQLTRIFDLVEGRQNVSLVGPRRIGKTSLLTSLQNSSTQQKFDFDGSRFLFLYLDLQKRSLKAGADFFDSVYLVLKQNCQNLGYTVPTVLDKDDELDAILDEFQHHGLHPVLLMDTFDEIKQHQGIKEDIFSFLRAEGNVGRISYVVASVASLGEIIRELLPSGLRGPSPTPFYNIFATIRLTSFSLQEAQELLVSNSSKGGIPFCDEEIGWLIKMAGTHPFFLQQVAALLFEEKRGHGGKAINYTHLQNEAQQNLSSHFEDCWAVLHDIDHQAILESIARLEKNGQQDNEDGGRFSELYHSELFRDYLRSTGRITATPPMDISKVDTKEFKEILQFFDDPGKLGVSALISIPSIAARIERQQAISPTARGAVVQEALREALEEIRGRQPRSDAASDWLDYNLLYYRYFMRRRDLSHSQIAARLDISERQYYRLSLKALDRLWMVLTTREAPTPY